MAKEVLNDLYDYGLKIYQYPSYFKFSLDSILLAELVKVTNKTNTILDLCSGNGAIPLILSTKTKAQITGVEIQNDIYELGRRSISYNNLNKQIEFVNADIKNYSESIGNKKYDIITCNPPYFKVSNLDYTNKSDGLSIARHELKITLEDIFKIASMHLNTKGEFYLVHHIDRLDEIIILANKYKLNVKNLTLVKTKEENKPTIVLVRCLKDADLGIKIGNIYNIDGLKTYQNMFKEEL